MSSDKSERPTKKVEKKEREHLRSKLDEVLEKLEKKNQALKEELRRNYPVVVVRNSKESA